MQRNAPARGAVGTRSVVVSGAVWRARRRAGKSDPSRGRGTRAGDRDDRGALRDCGDGAGARRGPTRGGPPCDTSASNTRGRDHTRRRSRRADCSVGRFSGEAARPRRRSGSALRLDTARKPWHKRDDWLGPSEHRGGHRGSGAHHSRPSPRPTARWLSLKRLLTRTPSVDVPTCGPLTTSGGTGVKTRRRSFHAMANAVWRPPQQDTTDARRLLSHRG
jgi:hypothetical protein